MAKAQKWTFTVTDRKSGEKVRVSVEAKRVADVIEALSRLKAPIQTIDLVRHNGLGPVHRFAWETRFVQVRGARG